MTTVTVTLNHEHALRLLEDLELLGALTIQEKRQFTANLLPEHSQFTAMSYSTKDFKFNRDEAKER